MVKLHLLTFLHQIEALQKAVDGKTSPVRVDPQVIRSLLIDHHTMFQALHEVSNVKLVEPRKRESIN
jgi:hypothetical protein